MMIVHILLRILYSNGVFSTVASMASGEGTSLQHLDISRPAGKNK